MKTYSQEELNEIRKEDQIKIEKLEADLEGYKADLEKSKEDVRLLEEARDSYIAMTETDITSLKKEVKRYRKQLIEANIKPDDGLS